MRTRKIWGTWLAAACSLWSAPWVRAQDDAPARSQLVSPLEIRGGGTAAGRGLGDPSQTAWQPTTKDDTPSSTGDPVPWRLQMNALQLFDVAPGAPPPVEPPAPGTTPSPGDDSISSQDIESARRTIIRGQDSSLVQPALPLPIGGQEEGGFFAAFEYVIFRMYPQLDHQEIAFRGFINSSLNSSGGQVEGSGNAVLFANDASGPGSFQSGWKIDLGWKFQDGTVVTIDWFHVQEYTYTATANPVPRGFVLQGGNDANSFITAPVYNFSPAYAGPPAKPADQYGLWNAAQSMEILYSQRFDQYEATWRQTIIEDDTYRIYGLLGPRMSWIWSRWQWITTATDAANSDLDVGVYNNIVSNRLYGVHVGSGTEWWLGNGFAANLDLQAAGLIDVAKVWAAYQLGQHLPLVRNKRSIKDITVSPEVEGSVGLYWYPYKGISLRLGYSAMAFFNTIGATNPVDFNMGAIAPPYEHIFMQLMHGGDFGISIVF
jgi:hypothetical protein